MKRKTETYHLAKGDIVYATGSFLEWDGKKFVLSTVDDDTIFYDGLSVSFDENGKPFIYY